MKVKLDENLPIRLVDVLEGRAHDVDTVATEGLTGKPDVDVWASACREGRFFITQDLDFSDIRQFRPGTHPGLLLVRLREPVAEGGKKPFNMAFSGANAAPWMARLEPRSRKGFGMNRQKLELTWIGKDVRPKLEPRILLEDPEKSYHAQHLWSSTSKSTRR